jgi:hypothetical protein
LAALKKLQRLVNAESEARQARERRQEVDKGRPTKEHRMSKKKRKPSPLIVDEADLTIEEAKRFAAILYVINTNMRARVEEIGALLEAICLEDEALRDDERVRAALAALKNWRAATQFDHFLELLRECAGGGGDENWDRLDSFLTEQLRDRVGDELITQ